VRKTLLAAAVSAATLLLIVILFGPGYLTRADAPVQADAVVVFVGPGDEFRFKEARTLIAEGYARYLIVPAYGTVSRATENGGFEPLVAEPRRFDSSRRRLLNLGYAGYLEKTHVEMLLAKQILDRLGMHSALIVSSPFHTRRIGMISSRVFIGDYRISTVPSRFQQSFTVSSWFNREHLRRIATEYTKMVWFLLYEPFGRYD
jgi:uncharacterized SAM-binding protein YcdF (DUF218 family)